MKTQTAGTVMPTVDLEGPQNGLLTIRLQGDWAGSTQATASVADALRARAAQDRSQNSGQLQITSVTFDAEKLGRWDSQVLVGIGSASKAARDLGIDFELGSLPDGLKSLLRLSQAVPPRGERRDSASCTPMLTMVGQSALNVAHSLGDANLFLGQSLQSIWRFMRGKARFMRTDIAEFMQTTGPQALPIVGIINVLLGVILGFMGAVQLQQFGAQIYVADLVALGQTREIAPMMTAIVMAGRTGAAYAAQLGTMQVNEEIDALKTFGFSPMDFLVLPRMLALALMFPLLVLYADALGIFGGYIVGVGVLDLSTTEYIEQTRSAIDMGDVALGVIKGSVFGILVAVTGCMHGMQSGRSASAVGDATTSAVVSGIIAIIFTTAIFSVLSSVLGF